MARKFFPSPSLARSTRITIKHFFSLLQHPTCGEVAKQDFSAILCIAKWFQEAASPSGSGRVRVERRVEPHGIAPPGPPPLHSLMGGFFGVVPKKVRLILLHRSALCQTTWTPHRRPFFHKRRRANDLGESSRTLDSVLRPPTLCHRPTFFASTQKKSPFFSAPKKPKKSPKNWAPEDCLGLDLAFRRNTLLSRPCIG
jgi:hypothetical protein